MFQNSGPSLTLFLMRTLGIYQGKFKQTQRKLAMNYISQKIKPQIVANKNRTE
jgi:hypothetical protein